MPCITVAITLKLLKVLNFLLALAYKGIEYDYSPVHLAQGDGGGQQVWQQQKRNEYLHGLCIKLSFQSSSDYKSLNPMAQVPTLVIDGHTFTQSVSSNTLL